MKAAAEGIGCADALHFKFSDSRFDEFRGRVLGTLESMLVGALVNAGIAILLERGMQSTEVLLALVLPSAAISADCSFFNICQF